MRARQFASQFDFLVALCLLATCPATVWAEEASAFAPEKLAAIATDAPTTPAPTDVAREVLRLQEEMGGSITKDFGELPQADPPVLVPVPQKPHLFRPLPKSPVLALREVAWQLEQSAHLLESLDLYAQADALRETADRLRKDARRMKAEHKPAAPGQSDVTSRHD